MFDFQPENKKAVQVPYFEDATKDEGWRGYSTTKSIKSLQAEIGDAMGLLGGIVSGFQRGTFQIDKVSRDGFQIHYSLQNPNGNLVPGRLDIAALPVRNKYDEGKREKSLRMALFMLRDAVSGLWYLQQLSPGYAPLMPWMLNREGKTVSQMWSENAIMSRLLPSGNEFEFIDGEELR